MKEFLDYKRITKYKFCNELGFSNKFLDNSSNMGTDKACKILLHYPEINAHWLLTGDGKMLKQQNLNDLENSDNKAKNQLYSNQIVPLYDLETIVSLRELFNSNQSHKIIDTLKIPNLPKCDGAVIITGDSMYPVLKSGDLALYKEIDLETIFFGEIYLISIQLNNLEEHITVKYILKSEKGDNFLKLACENNNYQANDVPISKITALGFIKASVRKNTMI
nr:S24 family peptidase [Flavobacterium sp. MC2016-06]